MGEGCATKSKEDNVNFDYVVTTTQSGSKCVQEQIENENDEVKEIYEGG